MVWWAYVMVMVVLAAFWNKYKDCEKEIQKPQTRTQRNTNRQKQDKGNLNRIAGGGASWLGRIIIIMNAFIFYKQKYFAERIAKSLLSYELISIFCCHKPWFPTLRALKDFNMHFIIQAKSGQSEDVVALESEEYYCWLYLNFRLSIYIGGVTCTILTVLTGIYKWRRMTIIIVAVAILNTTIWYLLCQFYNTLKVTNKIILCTMDYLCHKWNN